MVATAKTSTLPPADLAYWRRPLAREVKRFAKIAKGRRIRSRREFARACVVLPEGPHEGFNWRPEFQPYCATVLRLMDELPHRKYRFSGCVQSGKSFVGVICVLWHLLERGEDVGYAVPDLDQSARDKWHQEFLPVIMASPELRKMLPESGEGSKGGTPSLIKFKNGATLRFISGEGKDKHRSNFTVHVVFKTEVDRYDTPGAVSRESSPPEQIDNRTKAYQATNQAFSYEECTVTEETGRIWLEIQESTNHRLHVRCVHCAAVVCPGREDFHGVEDAENVEQARAAGHFCCPACSQRWTESQRQVMLDCLIPVGCGQSVRIGTDGVALVEGELYPTNRLGFTWNAFHNKFWTTANIAEEEWLALYSRNPDDKDLERRQHAWTIPAEPDVFTISQLYVKDIVERAHPAGSPETDWRRTIPLRYAPPQTVGIVAGVDVGKRWLHFVVRAFYETPAGVNHRIIDLGEAPVETDALGIKKALPKAFAELSNRFNMGYGIWGNEAAGRLPVTLRCADGGYQGKELGKQQEDLVWLSLLDLLKHDEAGGAGWLMVLGRGQSEPPGKGSYSHPQRLGGRKDPNRVLWVGEQVHIRRSAKHANKFAQAGAENPASYAIANSDHFKQLLRTSYGDTPIGEDGAGCSFNAFTREEKRQLREYAKQLVAEERISKPVIGRGRVIVFENKARRPNHFGDADYYSLVAASVLDLPISVLPRDEPTLPPRAAREPVRTPGDQKFLATQR